MGNVVSGPATETGTKRRWSRPGVGGSAAGPPIGSSGGNRRGREVRARAGGESGGSGAASGLQSAGSPGASRPTAARVGTSKVRPPWKVEGLEEKIDGGA